MAKRRLGPLWWYALLVFLAQRFADVLNLYAGMWLVPRYVPESELGAIPALMQFGALFSVPMAVLVTPFVKILNKHATNGEYGKVKALLRDSLLISAVILCATMLIARLVLPSILDYIGIQDGRLTMVIVFASVLGGLAPIFSGALQALKRFATFAALSVVNAPLRVITLLITLPVRGLTGYFVGQSVGPILTICVAAGDFFKKFGRKVKCQPYLRQDMPLFVSLLIPLTVLAVIGNMKGAAEMTLLNSLPKADSAAYYHLTRFSEIATYIISPVVFVMFPIVAEKSERGTRTTRVVFQTMALTIAVGAGLAIILHLTGPWLFSLRELWRNYMQYTSLFGIATALATIRMASSCFTTHEAACARFRYALYTVPIYAIECVLIYTLIRKPGLLGFSIGNLGEFFQFCLVFALIPLAFMLVDLMASHRREKADAMPEQS